MKEISFCEEGGRLENGTSIKPTDQRDTTIPTAWTTGLLHEMSKRARRGIIEVGDRVFVLDTQEPS